MKHIEIRGARTHNLKNISTTIPRDKLVVITGLSGSGKSSLAFDTLYAEGQRRYVESLSAYARQFLSMMEKPDVDHIEGLSPAISIEQKSTSHNPRSTVGTVTEIYDYLRLLYARVGEPLCPTHQTKLAAQTVSQMVDAVLALPEDTKVMLLAPVVQDRKGEHIQLLEKLKADGYIRARINGQIYELDEAPELDLRKKHTIEVVVDRIKVHPEQKQRLAESFETILNLSGHIALVVTLEDDARKKPKEMVFSSKFACALCGYSLAELEPRLFSFNNPMGACPTCDGLGNEQYFDPAQIILDANLSLGGGAIRGWDRRNAYYYHLLMSLAKHYKFDIDKPFNKLPKSIQDIILYGSGEDQIKFVYVSDRGTKFQRTHVFEGVIPTMDRRYKDTESSGVREELAKYITTRPCDDCQGSRLKKEARHVFIADVSLPALTRMSVENSLAFIKNLELEGKRGKIAEKIKKELSDRLGFLVNVGLEYLTLDRSAETLSGGEGQRIRLASQIGSGLVGVMYILDEPSIGLHQRDNHRLLETLFHLRELGNTVIVVEHDEDAIRHADWVIDIGPGAGVHGGEIIVAGPPATIMAAENSLTGQYLSGKQTIDVPTQRVIANREKQLVIEGAVGNNLKDLTVEIPVGLMTCITGVSGSGKSTLINDTLYPEIGRAHV